ncbi:MAG: hypothetical protein FJ147_27830 [Deltaproteobacteria bacterium]|nr:hypothetical protein [Deltaproteobacteria bacterium]
MKRIRIVAIVVMFLAFGQGLVAFPAHAGRDLPTAVGGGISSIIATVIALPVKVATCTAMSVVGGIGYGATLGESEFVQEEFVSGIPDACRPVLKTTPTEIDPKLRGPQPRDMAW